MKSLLSVFGEFLQENAKPTLLISLEFVQFDCNARELIANAIGRDLIRRARGGDFADAPLLVFLDEAHQFLNRTLGDEDTAPEVWIGLFSSRGLQPAARPIFFRP